MMQLNELLQLAHHFGGAVSAEAIGELDVRLAHIGPVEEDDSSSVQDGGVHGRYAGVVQQQLYRRNGS